MSFDFVSNDTGSVLNVTCKDKATALPLNLTGFTINLCWINQAAVLVTKAMTIATPAAGLAKYQFLANELFAPTMIFEVRVFDPLGKLVTSLDPIIVSVRQGLL